MSLYLHELHRILRRPGAFRGVVFLVAAGSAIVGIRLNFVSWSFGAEILRTFSVSQLLVVLLIALASTIDAITGERERDTWTLLVSTPLRPAEIAFAKIAATSTYTLVVLAAAVPITASFVLLGGVRPESIVVIYAVTLFIAGTGCAVSLVPAILASRSSSAATMGLVWFVIVFGVVPAALHGLGGVADVSPFEIIRSEILGRPRTWVLDFVGVWTVVAALHIAFFLLRAPRRGERETTGGLFSYDPTIHPDEVRIEPVRRDESTPGETVREATPSATPDASWRTGWRASSAAGQLVELGRRGVPLLRSPVAQRALRSGPLHAFLFLPVLLFFFVVATSVSFAASDPLRTVQNLVTMVLGVIVPLFHAGGLSREYDERTLELLRTTPLRAHDLLIGHFTAALWTGILLLAALWFAPAVAIVLGKAERFEGMLTLGASIVGLLAGTWLTVCVGALFRRRLFATGAALFVGARGFGLAHRLDAVHVPFSFAAIGFAVAYAVAILAIEARFSPDPLLHRRR